MIDLIFWFSAFAIAITIHEYSHAYISDKLGDPTARLMGRLSLNPLVHYDTIGTTLLLITTIMRMFNPYIIPFGWAKPVPYDPFNLKNPRKDSALISIAGPMSNLIIAIISSLIIRISSLSFLPFGSYLFVFLQALIILNVALAIFNLIPIHPLDGGKILVGIAPEQDSKKIDNFLSRYGTLMLIFLIFPIFNGNSAISMIITPFIRFFYSILIPNLPSV